MCSLYRTVQPFSHAASFPSPFDPTRCSERPARTTPQGGSRTLTAPLTGASNRFGRRSGGLPGGSDHGADRARGGRDGLQFQWQRGLSGHRGRAGAGARAGPARAVPRAVIPFATFDREAAPGFPPIRNTRRRPPASRGQRTRLQRGQGTRLSARPADPASVAPPARPLRGLARSALHGASLQQPPGTFSGSLPQGGVKFGFLLQPRGSAAPPASSAVRLAPPTRSARLRRQRGGSFPAPKTPFSRPSRGSSGNINFDPNGGNIQFPPPSGQFSRRRRSSPPSRRRRRALRVPAGPGEGGRRPNLPFTIDDELAALLFGMQEATTSQMSATLCLRAARVCFCRRRPRASSFYPHVSLDSRRLLIC
ncbi:dapper homolog 3-like, partial [Penaeus monodon]|uniref:dapper homolog 3-like n=1 Tax=Penaeus monodon TaxID=6687 RepID=UPI0018A7CBA6